MTTTKTRRDVTCVCCGQPFRPIPGDRLGICYTCIPVIDCTEPKTATK